jgi:hypothetical protein
MITPSLSDDAYLTLYTICSQLSDWDEQLPALININCEQRGLSPEEFLASFMELCCDDLEEKLGTFLLH